MAAVPDLPPHCGSWIVTRNSDGAAVIELFTREASETVNGERYTVHTAADYLASLNAGIRAEASAYAAAECDATALFLEIFG